MSDEILNQAIHDHNEGDQAAFTSNETPLPMFSSLTPGELERLSVLEEEISEVGHIIGKIIRHGYESFHPTTKKINRDLLQMELGHVLWAMNLMSLNGDIVKSKVDEWKREKSCRSNNYLHHQDLKL